MNKESRIAKIAEIKERTPEGIEKIVWEDSLQSMNVYNIPLEYLIYNKYNGRILTRTKSLEAQGVKINVETDAGKGIIEKLLFESKPERNKSTQEDLERFGQKRVGIVTLDGVIIDGNRRAMLLNRIPKYRYFRAIILPVTLEDNHLEIEKLETSYQMGEDEKLGYNPIEKYLKSQNLKDQGVAVKDIASWMNEPEKEIQKYIRTMNIMDEYLEAYNYDKMYTRLDNREDAFLSVEKWCSNLYGEDSARGFDGYTDGDVDDLKSIAFDYIRAVYEKNGSGGRLDWKSLRILADGNKDSHLFGNRELWKSFSNSHFNKMEAIKRAEDRIDMNVPNLEKTLKSRDALFSEMAMDFLVENFDNHREKLGNQRYANEPEKLVGKAIDAIKIAQSNKNIGKSNVIDKVEELNDLTIGIMKKQSPIAMLRHINYLLENVDLEMEIDKDSVGVELKKIQSRAYKLGKEM